MNEGLYNLNNEDGTASLKGTTDPTRACGVADCCPDTTADGCESGVKRPAPSRGP